MSLPGTKRVERLRVPAIICVGPVHIDTILTVPLDDAKELYATSKIRQVGGHCANTLQVLQQLSSSLLPEHVRGDLSLISVLPGAEHSTDYKIICDTLESTSIDKTCIFRPLSRDATSNYIIEREGFGDETTVSYKDLEDMTLEEFKNSAEKVLDLTSEGVFHFESGNRGITLACFEFLRNDSRFKDFKISVSLLSKPRESKTLPEFAKEADILFCSTLWSPYYLDHGDFTLETHASGIKDGALLFCLRGAAGIAVARRDYRSKYGVGEHYIRPAFLPDDSKPFIEAVGQREALIAGVLFTFCLEFDLEKQIAFGIELAGWKAVRKGFAGIVKDLRDDYVAKGGIPLTTHV